MLCDISRSFPYEGGYGPPNGYEKLADWESFTQKDVPPSAPCPDGRRTFQARGYGNSLWSFGTSPDGAYMSVIGGWQMAPMFGGGYICYYRRAGQAWQRLGCELAWES